MGHREFPKFKSLPNSQYSSVFLSKLPPPQKKNKSRGLLGSWGILGTWPRIPDREVPRRVLGRLLEDLKGSAVTAADDDDGDDDGEAAAGLRAVRRQGKASTVSVMLRGSSNNAHLKMLPGDTRRSQ